jgi:hypothetical protein
VLSDNEVVGQGPALDSNNENDLRDDQTETENNVEVQEVPINNTNVETDNNGDNNENIIKESNVLSDNEVVGQGLALDSNNESDLRDDQKNVFPMQLLHIEYC